MRKFKETSEVNVYFSISSVNNLRDVSSCRDLKMSPVIVVHGGAWGIPDELAKACVDGVKVAACEGFSVLRRGGGALDAVEAAVRSLEDNEDFNAGTKNTFWSQLLMCLSFIVPPPLMSTFM